MRGTTQLEGDDVPDTSKNERYKNVEKFFDESISCSSNKRIFNIDPPHSDTNQNIHQYKILSFQRIDRTSRQKSITPQSPDPNTTHDINIRRNGSPQVGHQVRRHRLRSERHQQRRSGPPGRQDLHSFWSIPATAATTTSISRPRPILRPVWLPAPKLVRFLLWPSVQRKGELGEDKTETPSYGRRYLRRSTTRLQAVVVDRSSGRFLTYAGVMNIDG